MVGHVNDAAIALLLSIGHQTGLFDSMTTNGPATSAEIASTARLDERYVREWLGGMVCAAVIDYDSSAHTCHLPAHRAPALTRAGGARQCRQDGPVHRAAGRSRAAYHRVFPRRGWIVVQRVSTLSFVARRRERHGIRRSAGRHDSAVGRRADPTTERRYRRR